MIRVVLVDDADDMRMLLRVALEGDGRFEVVGDAADGMQAMELVAREKPDVLVLDMAMPRMDGLEVLKAIAHQDIRPKVLAFSGFNDMVKEQATALGADAYLRKGSTTLEELVPRLLALFA